MCLYNVCMCMYILRILCIGLYILQTDKYRVQPTGFILNWVFITLMIIAKDDSMPSWNGYSMARTFPMHSCSAEQQVRAVGWTWAASDSVNLGQNGCLIARCIFTCLGLNPHKVWWAESAWVHSYDWNTMQARPGGPRDPVFGVYFKL